MTKLYVGNLPYSTTDADLTDLFAEFGEVTEAVIISDRNTGRSKGFGFVSFEDDDAAQAAVAGIDGKELEGRGVRVSVARPKN